MAKEFVPGSVGVHDAAGIYQEAVDFYDHVLAGQAEAADILNRAYLQLDLARESRPDLVEKAEAVLVQAQAVVDSLERIRVTTMGVYAQTIGSVLEIVRSARMGVEGDEIADHLGQFDLDLERIEERYAKLYAPFFGLNSGELMIPDVQSWGSKEWERYRDRIEGPILLWRTISECSDRWKAVGIPPCHGPDYLTAWRLANQTGIIRESHAHALEALGAPLKDFFIFTTRTITSLILDATEGIVLAAAAGVKGAVRGGGLLPLLLIAGIVYVAATTQSKSKE